MKNQKTLCLLFAILCSSVLLCGCSVKYTLSGASISPLVKTVTVNYFPNNALMVAPILSSSLTDALQDRFSRQTKLIQVREGGDINFEGEITNYTSTAGSISGQEVAVLNNLTVSVRVRFTNSVQPELNYDKTFTASQQYNANKLLQEVEPTLIPELVDQLVEDIFNAAVANW